MLADLVVIHLKGEPCCCDKCDRNYFAADCGPGLVEKEIIDRLGRKSKRCVRQDEAERTEGDTGELPPKPDFNDFDATEKFLTGTFNDRMERDFGADPYFELALSAARMEIVKDQRKEMRDKYGYSEPFRVERALVDWKGSSIGGRAEQIHIAISVIKGDSPSRYEEEIDSIIDLGLEIGVDEVSVSADNPDVIRVIEELTESMVKEQAYWADKAGDKGTIRLYRGVNAEGVSLGPNVSQDLPASSWSLNSALASNFGNVVMAREARPDEIIASLFSGIGNAREGEVILYTSPDGAEIEVIAA